MSRGRVLAAIAAWLVVVAGASTLVWAVISRAGEEVVSSQQPMVATTGSHGHRPSGPSSTPSSGERRTWQGPGGLLIAECDGRAISRISTVPDDGYAAEVKDDGPQQLTVEFEGREDQEGTSVTVAARCVRGVPDFTSQTETEGEDD